MVAVGVGVAVVVVVAVVVAVVVGVGVGVVVVVVVGVGVAVVVVVAVVVGVGVGVVVVVVVGVGVAVVVVVGVAVTDPKLRPGTNHCLCPVCGEYFTTERNYEMHRRTVSKTPYKRVCLDPRSLLTKRGKARLRRNPAGLWASGEPVYIPK